MRGREKKIPELMPQLSGARWTLIQWKQMQAYSVLRPEIKDVHESKCEEVTISQE